MDFGKFDDIDILFIALIGSYLLILFCLLLTIFIYTARKKKRSKSINNCTKSTSVKQINKKEVTNKKKKTTSKVKNIKRTNNSTKRSKGYVSPTKKRKKKRK